MAATANLVICTSTNAATETSDSADADNLNLMSTDAVDTDGEQYKSYPITKGESTVYSMERWWRIAFQGTFNNITDCKFYKSAGTLSDAGLDVLAGATDTGATPVSTVSSVATNTLTDWDSVGEAISIQPSGGIDAAGEKTNYGVLQLKCLNTTTTPGDTGELTITVAYNES